MLSGDVQLNPGPNASVHPCGICQESVTWSCKGICCDSCDIWFHYSCVDVGSAEYEALSRPTVAWICSRCDSINCSSFTFRSYELECSNFYDPLQHSHIEFVDSSRSFSPARTSSPKISSSSSSTSTRNSVRRNKTRTSTSSIFELPKKTNLRIMNVNCQCLSSKKQELAAAIQYIKPDNYCLWHRIMAQRHKTRETGHQRSHQVNRNVPPPPPLSMKRTEMTETYLEVVSSYWCPSLSRPRRNLNLWLIAK